MNKYIVLDVETGGIGLGTSLLTAYFAVFDENFNLTDSLYLYLKPEDDRYVVTAEALGVNGINLIEHQKRAMTYKDAKPLLYNFLKNNHQGEKLIPIGHGIVFDIVRVKEYLISSGSWESFVSYRTLDTSSVARFLNAAGCIPDSVSGSLGSLVKHFNLPSLGELHDAKTDALQTVEVLKCLFKLVWKFE